LLYIDSAVPIYLSTTYPFICRKREGRGGGGGGEKREREAREKKGGGGKEILPNLGPWDKLILKYLGTILLFLPSPKIIIPKS
jgi:hypothetical protein